MDPPSSPVAGEEDNFVRIGDQISFAIGSSGHLGADEILGSRVYVVDDSSVVATFQDCIFRVSLMKRYTSQTAYQKYAEKVAKQRPLLTSAPSFADFGAQDTQSVVEGDISPRLMRAGSGATIMTSVTSAPVVSNEELADLKTKAEQEEKQNELEMERSLGKVIVTYGMGVQLQHVKTSKFLTRTLESSNAEKENMRLILDELGSKKSFFIIMPVHKMRSPGEPVRFGDQVMLVSLQNRSEFMHISEAVSTDGLLEANIGLSSSRFVINEFASHVDVSATDHLKAGDVILLYHKEHEGFLSIPDSEKIIQRAEKEVEFNSIFNEDYRCYVTKIEVNLSTKQLLLHYEVYGNNSLGPLQYASGKELRCKEDKKIIPLLTCIWKTKDPSSKLSGALVYELGFFEKGKTYTFGYGVGGYKRNQIFVVDEDFIRSLKLQSVFPIDEAAEGQPRDITSLTSRARMALTEKIEVQTQTSGVFIHQVVDNTNAASGNDMNSSNMWLIEKEMSSRGGVIGFDQRMRLKHLASGRYLSIKSVETSYGAERVMTTTTDTDAGSLFTFTPVLKKTSSVTFESLVRIRTVRQSEHETSTAGFLRQFELQDVSPLAKPETAWLTVRTSPDAASDQLVDLFHPVGLGSFCQEDVFSLHRVGRDDVKSLYFATGIIPVLKNFLHECKTVSIDDLSTDAFAQALTQLILFLTVETDETDPMRREGIPVPTRQNFVRECGVLDILLQVLHAQTHENLLRVKTEKSLSHVKSALRLCYRAIKQSCKDNASNSLFVAKDLPFLQSQGGYELKNADTVMEIFRSGNVELLESVSENVIEGFFANLRAERNPRILTLMATACTVSGQAYPNMQKRIGELVQKNLDLLLPIKFNEEKTQVFVQWPGGEPEPIAAFSHLRWADDPRAKKGKEADKQTKSKYLDEQIVLLSQLAKGRNTSFTNQIRKHMPVELIEHCLLNSEIDWDLRARFCTLMMNLYVDNHPHVPMRPINYTRSVHTIGSPPSDDQSEPNREGRVPISVTFLNGVRSMVESLSGHQTSSEFEKNKFIQSLLMLLHKLVHFGFYDKKSLDGIKSAVLAILDSATDEGGSKKRFKVTEKSLVIMKTKTEALSIMNLLLDCSMNDHVTNFFQAFSSQAKSNEKDGGASLQHFLQKVFGSLDENNEAWKKNFPGLTDCLTDLVQYEYKPLAKEALRMLNRICLQKDEFWNVLEGVQVLDDTQLALSRVLVSQIEFLHEYIKEDITPEDFRSCVSILNDILSVLKDPQMKKLYQRLLRNLGMIELALHAHRVVPTMNSLIAAFNAVLAQMCRYSKKCPELLVPHVPFFLSRASAGSGEVELIYAILNKNRSLCSRVDINQFVSTFHKLTQTQRTLTHSSLDILRAIINEDSSPPPRTQIAILKSVNDKFRDIGAQFTRSEWFAELSELISNCEQITNERESRILYYAGLLDLFANCAAGKNHTTEYMSQQAFPLHVLASTIMMQSTVPFLKKAAIHLLDEAFLCTERPVPIDNALLEAVVASISELIQLFAIRYPKLLEGFSAKGHELKVDWSVIAKEIAERDQQGLPLVSTASSAEAKKLQQSVEHSMECQEVKEWEELIFSAALPFLEHYLAKKFSKDNSRIIQDLTMLAESLGALADVPHPAHQRVVDQCKSGLMVHGITVKSSGNKQYLPLSAYDFTLGDVSHVGVAEPLGESSGSAREHSSIIQKLLKFSAFVKDQPYSQSNLLRLGMIIRSNNLTKNLITLCGRKNTSGRVVMDDDIELSSQGAQVLTQVVRSAQSDELPEDESQTDHYKKAQKKLDEEGATSMALRFIASGNDQLMKDGLELAITLMDCEGGNRSVQRSFLQQLQKSSVSVLEAIESQVSRGELQIKERKAILKKAKGSETAVEPFVDTLSIRLLFRFLQLLCEGHYNDMQEFLQRQDNAAKSINIVIRVLEYVSAMEKIIDRDTIEIAAQAFSTLTEFIQGPCHKNQGVLGVASLFACSNSILFVHNFKDFTNENPVLDLKNKVMITLLSLLEGVRQPHVARTMVRMLDLDAMFNMIDDALVKDSFAKECTRLALKAPQEKDSEAEKRAKELDLEKSESSPIAKFAKTAEGFLEIAAENENLRDEIQLNGFILLSSLAEEDRNGERMVIDPLHVQQMKNLAVTKSASRHKTQVQAPKMLPLKQALVWKTSYDRAWKGIKSRIGRVEIDRLGTLERVYFRIPDMCKHLDAERMADFPYQVDQDESNKITDFIEKAEIVIMQMKHNMDLSKIPVLRRIPVLGPMSYWLVCILSIVINLILMTRLVKPDGGQDDQGDDILIIADENGNHSMWSEDESGRAVFAFGIALLALLIINTMFYFIKDGLVDGFKRNLEFLEQRTFQVARYQDNNDQPWWLKIWDSKIGTQLNKAAAFLSNGSLLFRLAGIGFAVAGLVVDPAFFGFHIFAIVFSTQHASSVTQAVTKNGISLLFTALLGVITMWVFSLIAFSFFNDQMIIDDLGPICQSAGSCFLNIVNFGIRGGGFWEGANFPFDERPWRIVFNMAFVITINIILLNMIFGIIIDTFGELREEKAALNESIQSKCFICSIEKARFDREADGLDAHQENDHNLWHYLYFAVYLIYIKDPSEFTGIEQFVHDLFERKDYSFIPQGKAMVLEAPNDDDLLDMPFD